MKRRGSTSSTGSNKRSKTRQAVVRDFTSSAPVLSVRNSKAVRVRVPRKVKVGAKLKAKITKVINQKKNYVLGSYTNNFSGYTYGARSRIQNVVTLPGYSNFHFTTNDFLNAASVLFNNKVVPGGPELAGQKLAYYAPAAANAFNQKYVQIEVRNSYSYYTFKNGSQHTMEITLCVCVPKKKGSVAEWTPTSYLSIKNDGSTVANPLATVEPVQMWISSLAEDYSNQQILQGYMVDGSSITAAPALRTPDVTDMWRRPTESPTFNNAYKVEMVKLTVLPGQILRHKIQGPQDLFLDYAKLYQQDNLLNVQKFTRGVFAILVNQPNSCASVSTSTGAITADSAVAGRWGDQIDVPGSGFGLFVERTDHFSIRLPEQAGFQFPVISSFADISEKQQLMSMRRPKSITNNYFLPTPAAGVGTVKEAIDLSIMNPVQAVKNGI